MKKLVAYVVAFTVALFCAATLLSPAVAGASESIQAPGKIVSVRGDVVTVDVIDNYVSFFVTVSKEGDIVFMLLFGENMEAVGVVQLTQLYRPLP